MKKNTEQVEAQTDDFQTITKYILGIVKGFFSNPTKKSFLPFLGDQPKKMSERFAVQKPCAKRNSTWSRCS